MSASKKNPNIIRKLGHLERLQSAQHLLGVYLACALSCRYAIPDVLLTTEFASMSVEDTIEKALAQAILEHPLFQVGLVNENSKKPSWVRLDRIDLQNHVEWRTIPEGGNYEEALQEVLEWQINHRFTHLQTQPRWRSVILRPTNSNFVDVVFAWDHAAGDGKSGMFFHESLLKCLNFGLGGKNIEPLKGRSFEVPVTTLTPPQDKLLRASVSCGFLVTEGWQTLRPPSRTSDYPYAVAWAPIQLTPFTTRVAFVAVEEDALQAVLGACRQHQTTLTGFLHVLILVSMATRLPTDKARAFQNGTPICLRRYTHPRQDKYPGLDMEHTVANAVTYWFYKFDEELVAKVRQHVSNVKAGTESNADLEATMWSAAKVLRQELSKKLDSGMKDDTVGLTKFVSDWRAFVKDGMKPPRTNSWEISNLGVIDGGMQRQQEKSHGGEKWAIERTVFTQSSSVSGPAITVNPIATTGKGLTMTCVWQIEVVDDELVQGLSSDLGTWLNGLGENGHITFNFGE